MSGICSSTVTPERRRRIGPWLGIALLTMAGCSEPPLNCQINRNVVDNGTASSPIHDPSIEHFDGRYYVYSSSALGSFYQSADLRNWQASGAVFDAMPDWLLREIPEADHIGAPDISYYQGRYLLFYQSHISDTCNAATGLATNAVLDPKHPDYEWVDHGLILRFHHRRHQVDST
jgi:arabinan endo-1,5-alpha-L-arabinosidase